MALSLPVVASMLLQSAYALIDLAFVGRLGEAAVAGLSISFQAFFLILALSQVIGTAALAGISQDYGSGDIAGARSRFSGYCVVGVGLGVVTAALAYQLCDEYIAIFTDVQAVLDEGTIYFQINSVTFFTQLMLIIFGTSLRGSGDFATPMRFMVLSVGLNLLLDPVLIFGLGPIPAFGLAGAAWATVIAQWVSMSLYAYSFIRPSRDPRALRFVRPQMDRELFGHIFSRGLPAGAQFLLLSAVLGVVLYAVKPYGAVWTAVAGGGFRVIQQGILPMVAVAMASAAIVGQNLGAGHIDRIRRVTGLATVSVLVWGLFAGAMVLLFGRQLSYVFVKSDAEITVALDYFQLSSPIFIAFGCTLIATNVMAGLGRTVPTLLAALVKLAVLAAALLFVLPALSAPPVWIFGSQVVAQYVEAALGLLIIGRALGRLGRGDLVGDEASSRG